MNLEHSDVINTLTKHFEEERRLQNELDKMLSTELMLKKSKSELLLQKWHEDVYIPLITKINKEMNTCAKHIHDFRRTHHSKYLKHTNKKGGHVFLDIYEKSEYDPMMTIINKVNHLKVVTNWKNDPLLLQILSSIEDNSFLKSYDTGKICNKHVKFPYFPPLPLLPLSRSGISCKSWLDMELQDIQSAVRKKSQRRFLGIRNCSIVPFQMIDKTKNGKAFDVDKNIPSHMLKNKIIQCSLGKDILC
ncbi:protein FAM228B isoform X1 [Hydra vulgaris]|uniref:protein FAM228B isoform X1 n=1 Tax=Hydra vulgaris TaxID=6087 RepID=UPI001F5E8A4A|nr:protein FAM228B isoform X1 [Hydra vulgaris]XP_047128334.1 protein FAM228B isoform X1 [Hydra vulgaris]XP_047128335.1 protein FAM228B isoform X1 [Hydra vulgaris]